MSCYISVPRHDFSSPSATTIIDSLVREPRLGYELGLRLWSGQRVEYRGIEGTVYVEGLKHLPVPGRPGMTALLCSVRQGRFSRSGAFEPNTERGEGFAIYPNVEIAVQYIAQVFSAEKFGAAYVVPGAVGVAMFSHQSANSSAISNEAVIDCIQGTVNFASLIPTAPEPARFRSGWWQRTLADIVLSELEERWVTKVFFTRNGTQGASAASILCEAARRRGYEVKIEDAFPPHPFMSVADYTLTRQTNGSFGVSPESNRAVLGEEAAPDFASVMGLLKSPPFMPQ